MLTFLDAHEKRCGIWLWLTMLIRTGKYQIYFTLPTILAHPIKEKPLVLYIIAIGNSLGALLVQVNDEGKKNA